MANRFARKTGNWNASDVWSDTAAGAAAAQYIPGAGDVAMANSFAITVNVSATCSEVRTDTTGGATAGGWFTLADGVTLTANAYAGSSTCVYYAGSSSVTLNGNSTAGSTAYAYGIVNDAGGTFTINGNVSCGSVISSMGSFNRNGVLNIVGNVVGGSTTNTHGIEVGGTPGTINVTGNVSGGSGSGATGIYNANTTTVSITGNVNGGSNTNTFGVHNYSTGTVTITGNATGGSGPSAVGANNLSTGVMTISGDATGGTGSGAYGAYNAALGTLRVGRAVGNDHGPGYSTNNGNPGVYGYGTNSGGQPTTTVGAIKFGAYGQAPIAGRALFDPNYDASATAILIRETTFAQLTFTGPSNTSAGDPAPADVRYGTSYRFGAKTGTCRVPAAASVLTGVLVDNTTGTAAVGASDIRAAVGLASANLDTQLSGINAKTTNLPSSPAAVGSAMTLTSAYDAAKSAASQTSVDAIPTTPLLASNYTAPPSASSIRTEMDSNSTKLANLDATISSRASASSIAALHDFDPSTDTVAHVTLVDTVTNGGGGGGGLDAAGVRSAIGLASANLDTQLSGIAAKTDALPIDPASQTSVTAIPTTPLLAANYTAPPTVIEIRSEMDANSTKLANLDAAVSSRASASSVSALHDFDPSADVVAHVTLVDTVTNGGGGGGGLDAAGVRSAIGLASANLDTQISLLPNAGNIAWSVWNYEDREITDGGGATAQEVWEYNTRTLTEKTGFSLTSDYDAAKTAVSVDALNIVEETVLGLLKFTVGEVVNGNVVSDELDYAKDNDANLVVLAPTEDGFEFDFYFSFHNGITPDLLMIRGFWESGEPTEDSYCEFSANGVLLSDDDSRMNPSDAQVSYVYDISNIQPDENGQVEIRFYSPSTDSSENLILNSVQIRARNSGVLLSSEYDAAKTAASQTSVDALHDFDPASDTVAHVTLVDTVTNGGGGGGPTAPEIADAVRDELAPELASVAAIEDRLAEQVPDGPVVVLPAPGPGQTLAWTMCYDATGVPEEGVEVSIKIVSVTGAGGAAYDSVIASGESNADGLVQIPIPRGTGLLFAARRGAVGRWIWFRGVDAETLTLPRMIGSP